MLTIKKNFISMIESFCAEGIASSDSFAERVLSDSRKFGPDNSRTDLLCLKQIESLQLDMRCQHP